MIPFFLYPIAALLALLSVLALAVIYIFRSQFKRYPVSSLMLWRFAMQPRVGGSKRERLQLPLIFFIELAALAMLGLAAGGPVSKLAAHSRPLIIILDDSYSMRAVLETGTPQEQARAFLRELLQTQRSPSTRIILAGKEPRITSEPIHTHSDLEYQLQRWQCNAPRAAIEEAIGLANAIGTGPCKYSSSHRPRPKRSQEPK